jgi:hypothetical protein
MGAVFRAEHHLMGRQVALKVIRDDVLRQTGALERFEREVRLAARLAHPNIVMAFDADRVGATHFFVMEFIEGESLAERVKARGPLPVAEACDAVCQALAGLQHASQRGLVHRDLKPQNLLRTPDGVIKIVDFGLACFLSDHSPDQALTQPGTAMGTPDYLAPEQARDAHRADVRADIYSLGCTLYFLLTGRPPFAGGSTVEKLLKHLEADPPAVQGLRGDVPPGLAVVLGRMKAKRPADRYPTPAAAAAALAPFAADVSAGPPRRLWRRLVFAAALGCVALTVWGVLLARKDQPDAPGAPRQVMEAKPPAGPTGEPAAWRHRSVRPPDIISLVGHWDIVRAVAFSGDGRLAASSGGRYRETLRGRPADYDVRVWDVKSRRLHRRLPGHTDTVQHVVFATGGRHLLSGGRDGVLRVWDIERGRTVAQTRLGRIWGLAITSDGRRALSVTGRALQVWDLPGLKERQRWQDPPDLRFCAALSPKGNHGVTAGGKMGWQSGRPLPGADYALWLWDAATGEPLHRFEGHSLTVWSAVFSPDGRKILSAGADGSIRGWDVHRREALPLWAGHPRVVNLAVSPGGRLLASAGNDGTLWLWDLAAGKELRCLEGGLGMLHRVAWSPGGRHLLFSGDQGLKLWQLPAEYQDG